MDFNNEHMDNIEMIDFRRQQIINSRIEYNNYWNKMLRDGCGTATSLLILITLLFASNGADGGDNLRFIVIFTIGVKIAFLIPIEIIYLCIIKNEGIKAANIQLFKLFLTLPYIGWYIYVGGKFFQKDNTGASESIPLYIASLLIIIESFVVFFVMFCCLGAISCFIGTLCFIRRGEDLERQQNVKIKDILLGVTSLKLDSNQFNSNDDGVICGDEFRSDQQVVRLPGNAKHYFHADGIAEWIERKTVCPIGKTQITEELINQFKNLEVKKEKEKAKNQNSFDNFN